MVLSKFDEGNNVIERLERCLEQLQAILAAQENPKSAQAQTLECFISFVSATINTFRQLEFEGSPETAVRASLLLTSCLCMEISTSHLAPGAKVSAVEGAMEFAASMLSKTAPSVGDEIVTQ